MSEKPTEAEMKAFLDTITLDEMLESLPPVSFMRNPVSMNPQENEAFEREVVQTLEILLKPYKKWRLKNLDLDDSRQHKHNNLLQFFFQYGFREELEK